MAALRMMFSACVYSLPGLRPAELVRQIDRRRFFGLAAWAGFTWPDAANSADLYRGFGKTPNQLDRQIRESLFRSTSTPMPAESRPRNYGDVLLSNDRLYYTAESLLLSTLPVECPPLDVLRTELEKLYVLRDDIDMLDVGYGVGLGEPVRLISKRSAFSDTYWAVLREAQTEAVSAVVASRPLFRLFLSASTAKPGSRRLDELQQVWWERGRARPAAARGSGPSADFFIGNATPAAAYSAFPDASPISPPSNSPHSSSRRWRSRSCPATEPVQSSCRPRPCARCFAWATSFLQSSRMRSARRSRATACRASWGGQRWRWWWSVGARASRSGSR